MADYVDGMVLPTSAKLRRGKYSASDLETLTELAQAGARDPEAVKDAVFFPVVASANTIDSYGTFMLPNTLQNFAEDATEGRAVLDSHDNHRLNFGMSLTGEYVEDGDLRFMRSDFFTIPGLQTESLNTDAYIRGVQAGLFRDVSVGFYLPAGSMIRCTICGGDMMRWWAEDGCSHFPGVEYDVEGDGTTRQEVAYGAVDGARLSEYSLVYDGATPGAGVAKGRHMEDAGELSPEIALRLERAYNTVFPRAARIYRGFTPGGGVEMTVKSKTKRAAGDEPEVEDQVTTPEGQDDDATIGEVVETPDTDEDATVITPMEDDEPEAVTETPDTDDDDESEDEEGDGDAIERSRTRLSESLRNALNEKYADAGIRFGVRAADALVAMADEIQSLRTQVTTLRSEKRALEDEASDGRTYRKSLLDDLRSEIVRASGTSEDVEAKVSRYMRLADGASIEEIIGLRDDFASQARAKFGSGRRSVDSTSGGNSDTTANYDVPESAYDDV